MKNLISIIASVATLLCASAQTNNPVNTTPNFYLLSHPDNPPQPFTPDPSLPSYTNEFGVYVDDSWLELGRALMSSMDVPDPPGEGASDTNTASMPTNLFVHVRPRWINTNYLAGNTNSLMRYRYMLTNVIFPEANRTPINTNSVAFKKRKEELEIIEWLQSLPSQTKTNAIPPGGE